MPTPPQRPRRSRPGETPGGGRRDDTRPRADVRGRGGSPQPRVRRGTLRVTTEVAWHVRSGHPWIFRDALAGRTVGEHAGDLVEVVDQAGAFVARGLYDPTGPVAIRVIGRDPATSFDAASIHARVERARALRERLVPAARASESAALRVVHGDGDELPGISVDRYGDHLVLQLYSAAAEPHLPAILDALEAVWRPRGIYMQQRVRPQTGEGPRAPAELVRGEVAPVEIEVREGELRFAVDVTAPLGTGLFLDLRDGRSAVAELAAGRRVLNLFSYTGAFSVHAARGGAREVVSVDLATKAHGRARHNLALNQMGEGGMEFITGDAQTVMARMHERKRTFDLIIIDPPSFSQGKDRVFVAQKDYRELVAAALGVTAPGGMLACASNTARLPLDDFDKILGDGGSAAGRRLTVVRRIGLPVDFPVPCGFPEGHYLKFEIVAAD